MTKSQQDFLGGRVQSLEGKLGKERLALERARIASAVTADRLKVAISNLEVSERKNSALNEELAQAKETISELKAEITITKASRDLSRSIASAYVETNAGLIELAVSSLVSATSS